jgi:RND superfamily putative drug exporter
MSRLAHWCFQHRRRVVAGWIVILVAGFGVAGAVGSSFDTNTTLPGTDSQSAYNLLAANFPAASGEGDQMVIHTVGGGGVRSSHTRDAVARALTRMAAVPGVTSVGSPYATGNSAQISADGTIAFATVTWNSPTPKTADVTKLIAAADSAAGPGTQVSLGGSAISDSEGGSAGLSVIVGVIGALIILLLVFGGAFFPSLLPLLGTGIGILISLSVTTVLTHLLKIPPLPATCPCSSGWGSAWTTGCSSSPATAPR